MPKRRGPRSGESLPTTSLLNWRFLYLSHEQVAAPMRQDLTNDALRNAIVELAAALPVYRTYVDAAGASGTDRVLIAEAVRDAGDALTDADREAAGFLGRVLSLDVDPAISRAERARLCGPVSADDGACDG